MVLKFEFDTAAFEFLLRGEEALAISAESKM